MKPKPPLILKEKDLLKGIESRSIPYAQNLQDDLISVLKWLINYEEELKIHFSQTIYDTHRSLAGWWAYWLGIPVIGTDNQATDRFVKIYYNKNFFLCFKDDSFSFEYNLFDIFFGDAETGTLEEKLKRAKYLRYATN